MTTNKIDKWFKVFPVVGFLIFFYLVTNNQLRAWFTDRKLYVDNESTHLSETSPETVVRLYDKNNQEYGTLTLKEVSGRMVALLDFSQKFDTEIQSASLIEGKCDQLNHFWLALVPTRDGKSSTTYYGISIDQMREKLPLSAVVYQSFDENEAVACGEVLDL
jgi:hypothetical protein